MSSQMALAIRQLIQERGISEELVLHTIEDTLLAAYKRKYGTIDNAVVRFAEDGTDVSIYAQKRIVPEAEIDDPGARNIIAGCIGVQRRCRARR